ncbi:MAG: hypothetical protein FJZ67_00595 [Bacteroidetes bacterium]|nr:hypothetical protein [Bacteroidota bacterium]
MSELIDYVYIYCTDFTIFLANMFGISYKDSNTLIFCIIWPLFTMFLFSALFIQLILNKRKIKK